MAQTENRPIELVNINDIRVGDVIICSDDIGRTVGKKDIKYCSFNGLSIFGNTYKLGYEPVKRVVYERVLPIRNQ